MGNKRSRSTTKPSNNNPAAVDAANETTDTAVAADTSADATSDDAVAAALAMIEAATSGAIVPPVSDADLTPDGVDEAEALIEDEAAADASTALIEGDVEAVITEPTDAAPEDVEAALAELEAQNAPPPADEPEPTEAATQTKAPRTPKAPVVVREFVSVAAIDAPTLKSNLDGINAKKVQEKAQNLIQAIESGKKLSGYTKKAVEVLVADGKITSKSLVDAYLGSGLKDGTARAQAQQMTALFKAVGLATPAAGSPRELMLADNDLAKELLAA